MEERLTDYWVAAEISEMKVNYSGHCYLELVEKGGPNHVPRAKANAVIWRSAFAFIEPMFREQTGASLGPGLKVLFRVEVSYHELYGLSLVVRDVDPAYTLGDMERQRQETLRRLEKEGLIDRNRQLPDRPVYQRIAVISSSRAAGYQDFMNELTGNEYGFSYAVTLFNAVVQGQEAERSVVEALLSVAAEYRRYDVAVIIRGGGSQSDLGVFNGYALCAAVASMPLKVVTGIGHDKDSAVADRVASVSLKTPTAVARFLIDRTLSFDNDLTAFSEYLRDYFAGFAGEQEQWLARCAQELKTHTRERLHEQNARFAVMETFLKERTGALLAAQATALERFSGELAVSARRYVATGQQRAEEWSRQLRERTSAHLERQRARLENFSLRVEGFDPRRILRLGYAVARAGDRTVRSVRDVKVGGTLDVRVDDGVLQTEITRIRPDRKTVSEP